MKYDLICFDLQGTLSDSAFSDEFWLETLPMLYARAKGISLNDAKLELGRQFRQFGKYDLRYYSVRHWLDILGMKLSFEELRKLIKTQPIFYQDTLRFLEKLQTKAMLGLISSTTKEFIEAELGQNRRLFSFAYSSLDDFGIPGKPPSLYLEIARLHNTSPGRILYIGDSMEMDVINARAAGCSAFFFDKARPRDELIKELEKEIFSNPRNP
jgi:5'-nucleotidase